jgi:protein involved in polysaccharide export with SLBB domain
MLSTLFTLAPFLAASIPAALAATGSPVVDQALYPGGQSATTAKPASPVQPPLQPVPGTAVTPPAGGSIFPAPSPTEVAIPRGAPTPVPGVRTHSPQLFDYSANLRSEVFGANLFTGAFAREGATQFNPDYAVAVGDNIQVRFWGAFVYDAVLPVDPKGNIFLPHVGPVPVLGVRNQDLQRVVEAAVAKVFRANVFSYASLAAAQPVRVFVGGFVYRPGLYGGTSMDSLLHYLDQAGGIDPERGSFLNVQVRRGSATRATVNLYEFLLEGRMPLVQLADGDVIFVSPRQHTVKVNGLAENTRRFEFSEFLTVAALNRMARPRADATHVRVIRSKGTVRNVEYYPLEEAARVNLQNGDELEFTADRRPGTITVRVEGEHQSAQEYVLPYGTRLGEVIRKIEFSERSDAPNLQLFRLSVKERQRLMLHAALKSLEATALTPRSGTTDEALLRKEEAALFLQWVERAKKIEPTGQVLIAQSAGRDELLLENGDILRVPAKDGLVLVSGEVLFPNTIAFDGKLALEDYIRRAGGYTQNADSSRILIAHRDGSFAEATGDGGFFSLGNGDTAIRAGDEILVLPKIQTKWRQIAKELTQIIFQIALAAKVVLN